LLITKRLKVESATVVSYYEFWSEAKDSQDLAENTLMKSINTNNIGDTIRIRKPPRVFTNEKGDTIWMSEVEPVELEMELDRVVSTDPYDSGQSVSY
jgi:hypothetical protein